ncbi:MAG: hypothetical protein DMG96_22520 [Acidobacteria bacterium]|nr:MAG: hypothetical protein DMG96_22520 [Acidobacteriota bacterium]
MGTIAAMKSPTVSCAMILAFLLCALGAVYADSATWNLHPISNDWNTAANWTPNTVPNGPDDVATSGLSGHAGVLVSTDIEVSEVIFNAGASPFTITVKWALTISGIGITNNSGSTQNFVVTGPSRILYLTNNATAGENTLLTIRGGNGSDSHGGYISFLDTASADNGTFVIYGGETRNASGGEIDFWDNSSAGNGSYTVKGASVGSGDSGYIYFEGSSTAANGTFVVEGATASSFFGGGVVFDLSGTATAGNSVFLINGSSISGAAGGFIGFSGGTAANATLIANPGTSGGGGGTISFSSHGDGGEARSELFGNGTLEITYSDDEVTVGSIEGDGLVLLGTRKLITGSNNLSTTFSGTIPDTGFLEKIGISTLTLTGANTYSGGTTVTEGALKISNTSGSGTGTGAVQVNAGTVGGKGTVAGAVTVGTGSGAGAFLEPSIGVIKPSSLSIQSALTLKADSTYTYKVNTNKAKADKVIANGVTIDSGAQFNFVAVANMTLNLGKAFVAISNTAATPIIGTFANLPDGSTFTVGPNTFQVNYEGGGDGNDLTLTVVP